MTPLDLTADRAGERVDQFLTRSLPQLTRSAAQRLLEEGSVICAGQAVKKNRKTAPGEIYTVCIPDPAPVDVLPQDIPLEVAYEDADVIVVNKPVGLVVHPAPGHPDGTLVNALLYHCGNSLSGINSQLRPGIVHRIDRDTSGLIIAAKNDAAHLSLAAQLQDHSLYREAVTHWEVLGLYPGHTYVKCRLETGRTHQIRVHLASLGHPLLGDTVYGAKKPVPGLAGQCLHAKKLSFVHPRTGERVTVECELPDWFRAVLDKLEKRM